MEQKDNYTHLSQYSHKQLCPPLKKININEIASLYIVDHIYCKPVRSISSYTILWTSVGLTSQTFPFE